MTDRLADQRTDQQTDRVAHREVKLLVFLVFDSKSLMSLIESVRRISETMSERVT